jgi:hypothetical protein
LKVSGATARAKRKNYSAITGGSFVITKNGEEVHTREFKSSSPYLAGTRDGSLMVFYIPLPDANMLVRPGDVVKFEFKNIKFKAGNVSPVYEGLWKEHSDYTNATATVSLCQDLTLTNISNQTVKKMTMLGGNGLGIVKDKNTFFQVFTD